MEFKFVIFILSAIILVPFVYGAPILTHVCALPPDAGYSTSGTCGGWTENPSTGEVKRTCCWTEKEHVSGKILPKVVTYCQTCDANGDCKAKVKQLSPSGNIPEQEGGVLQNPTQPYTGPTANPNAGGISNQSHAPSENGNNSQTFTIPK